MLALAAIALPGRAGAQNPQRHYTDGLDLRVSRAMPVVSYVLTVTDRDTTGFDVEMRVRNAGRSFRVALARHPEYDDRYFQFLRNLTVSASGVAAGARATIAREDTLVWRVTSDADSVTIRYRMQHPALSFVPRAAWRPFQSSTGALTGGAHAFMYVIGGELAPSSVEVRVPDGWDVATGLTPTSDPRRWFAPNAYVLVESPILAGHFARRRFHIDGVPHTVAYWSSSAGTPFDTTAFVGGIERMTHEVIKLFGRPTYREYLFLFQDFAYGGLEHHNSVTLGLPSAELARSPYAGLREAAHEFFHTWNLIRIRPAEYTGLDYRLIQPVPTLWFSEGLTIFYADLLLRRAGLPTFDSTRAVHLADIITRYLAQPGHSHYSAEQVSRVAYNAPPGALGDYDPSVHLVGEVLGAMLDIVVRDATNGQRSMDDVMRRMLDSTNGVRGFTTADVERAVQSVCGCEIKPFFDAYVRSAHALDFDRYLGLIGLRAQVTWQPVMREGAPQPDLRIRAWNAAPDSALRLVIGDPGSVWGRAGLHSRDRLISVNDSTPRTWQEFRPMLARARIGDTLRFVVEAPGGARRNVNVAVAGYERPTVRIESVASPTEKQLRLRRAWEAAR